MARLELQWGIGIQVNCLSGTSMLEVPTEVVEGVLGLRMPIIVSHVVPDADALGSMLAVGLGLMLEVRVACPARIGQERARAVVGSGWRNGKWRSAERSRALTMSLR